jgi:hypothetical protein
MSRAFALLLACSLFGCGSISIAGPTDPDDQVPPADALGSFSRRQAQVICENLEPCCTGHGYSYDVEGCRARLAGELALRDTVASAGAVVDATAIDVCLARARDYAVACVPSDEVTRAYKDACLRVLTGPMEQGEPCSHDLACKQPKGGEGHARCASGTCVLELPPTEGEPCVAKAPSYSNCDTAVDTYCSLSAGKCLKRAPLGAPCLDTGGCLEGSYCRAGLCVAKAPAGGDCGGYGDGCLAVGACEPATKTCAARRALGEPCNLASECGSGSCDTVCQPPGLVAGSARCDG